MRFWHIPSKKFSLVSRCESKLQAIYKMKSFSCRLCKDKQKQLAPKAAIFYLLMIWKVDLNRFLLERIPPCFLEYFNLILNQTYKMKFISKTRPWLFIQLTWFPKMHHNHLRKSVFFHSHSQNNSPWSQWPRYSFK